MPKMQSRFSAADGRRLLILISVEEKAEESPMLIQNWAARLKKYECSVFVWNSFRIVGMLKLPSFKLYLARRRLAANECSQDRAFEEASDLDSVRMVRPRGS